MAIGFGYFVVLLALALGPKVVLVPHEASLLAERVGVLGFGWLAFGVRYVVLEQGCFAMGFAEIRGCRGYAELGGCRGLYRWMGGLWWSLELGRLGSRVDGSRCLCSLLTSPELLLYRAPYLAWPSK